MSTFEALITKVSKSLMYIAGGLLCVMMLITMVHVVGRYAFNHPIFGQSELVGLLQIVIVSFAGAYTVLQRRHVAIGLVVDRLPARQQPFWDMVTYFISLVFTALAAWQTFVYASKLLSQGKTTDMLHIVISPFYYVISFGWFLLSLGIVVVILDSVRKAVRR